MNFSIRSKFLKFVVLPSTLIVLIGFCSLLFHQPFRVLIFKLRLAGLKDFQLTEFNNHYDIGSIDWWAEGKVKNKGRIAFHSSDLIKSFDVSYPFIGITKVNNCKINITAGLRLDKLDSPIKGIKGAIENYDKISEEVKYKKLCKPR